MCFLSIVTYWLDCNVDGFWLSAEREAGPVQERNEKRMLNRVTSRPVSSWEDRTIGKCYGEKRVWMS